MTAPLDRRRFLGSLTGLLVAALAPVRARAYGVRRYFTWAQLRYPGVWDPNPRGPSRFLRDLARRTSVEVAPGRRVLTVGDPELYEHPFLYVAGRGSFFDPDPGADAWLGRYLEHGGFVLFDDATGIPSSRFAEGVRGWLGRALPGRPVEPLPAGHTVFQSFYLLDRVPGRKIVRPLLFGVSVEDLTPAILCVNDLGGAWEVDPLGGYVHPCVPGGERQRELAFRLGVNLVLYALTGNYKKDQVHIPFILKRRQR